MALRARNTTSTMCKVVAIIEFISSIPSDPEVIVCGKGCVRAQPSGQTGGNQFA